MPNVGAPDLRSMVVKKLPYTALEPGRINCVKATPTMVSACAWATAAGIVTGDIAPPRINGVITTP